MGVLQVIEWVMAAASELQVTLIFLFCVGTLMAIYRATCIIFSPLRSVPGPFFARFSRLWYFLQIWHGDFHNTNIKLHRQHGPIVRITPNEYSIDDPSALKIIYGYSDPFIKGPWYEGQRNPTYPVDDLFSGRDEAAHALNRRKVASLYSTTSLLKMEDQVTSCITLLESRFREIASRGQAVDLRHWLQCFAFDAIGEITLSKRFGFLDTGNDPDGLMEAAKTSIIQNSLSGVFSEFSHLVFKAINLVGGQGKAKVMAFAMQQIQQRLNQVGLEKTNATDADFLTRLLQMHNENPSKVSMLDALITVGSNIGAGSDTTSLTLTGIMWGLMHNSEALAKLCCEIDTKTAQSQSTLPLTFAETQKMPYLQAVIKEGLRVHPATGLPLWRVIPPGGAEVAGVFLPSGTVVGINPWVAHANRKVFGQDAHCFRPERWLGDAAECRKMENYLISFGLGVRTCIGKNISLMEISKVVPHLVRTFRFEPLTSPSQLRLENYWFVFQKEVKVLITEAGS